MNDLVKNIVRASVHHVAKEAMKWSTEKGPANEQDQKERERIRNSKKRCSW
jgi:hypothetical protein